MASGSRDSGETGNDSRNSATSPGQINSEDNSQDLTTRVTQNGTVGDSDGVRNRVNPDHLSGTNANTSATERPSLRPNPSRAPQPQTIPVPPPRRPIIDDNSIITRNQLAFLMTVTFGIIVGFGAFYVHKQVQTAYIVSSLLHNVPGSKTPYNYNNRRSSTSQPKTNSPKPIDTSEGEDVSSPSPVTNSYIESKLSPEVEIYAQQLQRVLGSLKRALRRIDKSDNSTSQLAGVIEMKPLHETLKEKQEEVMEAMHSASTPEVELETDTEPGTEPTKSSGSVTSDKSEAYSQKRTEKLTEAYTLAAEYVTNLNKIVDEQIRRSKAEEEDAEDLEENLEFDLEKKKEENVELFKRFVQLVAEAEALDDEYEEEGADDTSSAFEELKSKLQKSDANVQESRSPVKEIRTTISNNGDDEKTEQDIYNLLAEAFNGVDVEGGGENVHWNDDNLNEYGFEEIIGKQEPGAEIWHDQKSADEESGNEYERNEPTSGVKSDGEEKEPERKSREENPPLVS